MNRSTNPMLYLVTAIFLALPLVLAACMPVQVPAAEPINATAVPAEETPSEAVSSEATPTQVASAPNSGSLSAEVLANLTYSGIYTEAVQLIDGLWEGEPYDTSSISHPQVMLSESLAFGDLNGDGVEDAAVIVSYIPGGTGNFAHLAAVVDEGGVARNVATTEIFDRPIINALVIAEGQIHLDLTIAGPDDAMCCPTTPITQTWELQDDELVLVAGISAMDAAMGVDESDSDK